MDPQIPFQLLPVPVLDAARTALPLAFAQTRKATTLKPMHPPFDSRGVFAEPIGYLITTVSLAN
jgi:hypothetical protein